jgi:hypothetical protein
VHRRRHDLIISITAHNSIMNHEISQSETNYPSDVVSSDTAKIVRRCLGSRQK